MSKKILGLKLTAANVKLDNDGKKIKEPSSVAWALLSKDSYEYVSNITEQQVLDKARQITGDYIRTIRQSKKITIQQLSSLTNIPLETLEGIESGTVVYTFDLFLILCRCLDCYFVLQSRDGNHLNEDHLTSKIKGSDD